MDKYITILLITISMIVITSGQYLHSPYYAHNNPAPYHYVGNRGHFGLPLGGFSQSGQPYGLTVYITRGLVAPRGGRGGDSFFAAASSNRIRRTRRRKRRYWSLF